MHVPALSTEPERLADGVVVKQLDDLCFVHCTKPTVDAVRTRHLGEQLIARIERSQCRKLVITFDGMETVYGFLLHERPLAAATAAGPGSDVWVG